MSHTRTELLKSIRRRSDRAGLLTADRYFRSIESCFDGRFCPTTLFAAADRGAWETALKEAESRFVYADPAAGIDRDSVKRASSETTTEVSSGAVMDFDAVITTTRRDRDRDIMESSGAHVDPHSVLLWQHVPFQPIGRLLRVTEQTDKHVKARLSIADTELGRDAAVLLEFGALKISHGFEPIEFEPLDDDGWHFKRFEIFEVSLVSVPSNKDAVVTAYERRKLHSPLIKGWASHLNRRRSAQGAGYASMPDQGSTHGRTAPSTTDRPVPANSQAHPCRCGSQERAKSTGRGDVGCFEACTQFVARAASATGEDLDDLRAAHAALGQIVARLELLPHLSESV